MLTNEKLQKFCEDHEEATRTSKYYALGVLTANLDREDPIIKIALRTVLDALSANDL